MHYLRCIHPPSGATALTAVIGGPTVHALGYQYLVTLVLVNVVIILLIAVLVNCPFPWRRYPTPLVRRARRSRQSAQGWEQHAEDETDAVRGPAT
jgi:CBS-domain-containing membrane protein